MERGGAMKAGIEGWLILRTLGSNTLTLARSLGEDGFETWAPSAVRRIRVPRANVKRDVTMALLPSYVFVRARHLVDMLELAAMPEKPRRAGGRQPAHRDFSLFRYAGRIPVVADEDLGALRAEEQRGVAAPLAREFEPGQRVRVPSGSFEGMTGTVVRSNGRETFVCFGTRARVRISTFILEPIPTYSGPHRSASRG